MNQVLCVQDHLGPLGYTLPQVYEAFNNHMHRVQTGKRVRWQDQKFKFGMLLFYLMVDEIAYHNINYHPATSAKAKDFRSDFTYEKKEALVRAYQGYFKRTSRTDKLAVVEFYHQGCV